MTATTYDIIVVGSGVGGLTAASLTARLAGARVLVLEGHHRLGGLSHEFTRPGGLRWSVGLHYVGEMAPVSATRRLMDLVTGGAEWRALPDPFERFAYPGLVVEQVVGREAFAESLASLWPEERAGIEGYFRRVRVTADAWRRGAPVGVETTAAVIRRHIRAPELAAVLASQWGDYGLPPSRSAFVAHAVTVDHYLEGAWQPIGGSTRLVEGARAIIEAAGGCCVTSTVVDDILVERGRTIGVRGRRLRSRADEAVEYRAPVVISGIGALGTYARLLRAVDDARVADVRARLEALPAGYAAVQLFLGLSASAATLGARGENRWIFAGFDHDALYDQRARLLEGEAGGVYMTFPSFHDPAATRHTMQLVAPADPAAFSRWRETHWHDRGAEYDDMKQTVSRALLESAERDLPGLGALVDHQELATPLSVEHFTRHPHGTIYGLPVVPERFTAGVRDARTPVDGVYLAGADVYMHGIVGAMMGGVVAAGHALGERGFQRILAAASA